MGRLKKRVSINLSPELLKVVKFLDINISAFTESTLKEFVRTRMHILKNNPTKSLQLAGFEPASLAWKARVLGQAERQLRQRYFEFDSF